MRCIVYIETLMMWLYFEPHIYRNLVWMSADEARRH